MAADHFTAIPSAELHRLANAFVTVGEGRGFLVESRLLGVLVITAGHCLPVLPPPMPASYTEERTYADLIGPVGEAPTLTVECLFVDPVGDLAVLCAPDNQSLGEEWEAYEIFTDDRTKLRIGPLPQDPCAAWLLARDGEWCACSAAVGSFSRTLQIQNVDPKGYAPGTSGSPILTDAGIAIGVVSIGTYLNPVLMNHLPAWLLNDLGEKNDA